MRAPRKKPRKARFRCGCVLMDCRSQVDCPNWLTGCCLSCFVEESAMIRYSMKSTFYPRNAAQVATVAGRVISVL